MVTSGQTVRDAEMTVPDLTFPVLMGHLS